MAKSLVGCFNRFLQFRQIGPWDPSYLNGTVVFLEALGSAIDRAGGQAMVLDVGCGCGDRYGKKTRYGPRIQHLIGIDILEELEKNQSIDHAVRASVYDLPFLPAQFDVAFSDFVLEHLEYPERAFAEVARVLKPGGRFVFRTPNLYHYVPIVALLLRKMGYQPVERFSSDGERHEIFPTLYRANTYRRLRSLAQFNGLTIEEMILAEGGPHYLEFFLPFYLIGVAHQYLVNKVSLLHGLRGNIVMVLKKRKRA